MKGRLIRNLRRSRLAALRQAILRHGVHLCANTCLSRLSAPDPYEKLIGVAIVDPIFEELILVF